jgi:glucose 1-dehydrogenase
MKGLKAKNALITGASSGISQAIAVRFATEGVNVAINYRKNPEDAAETEEMVNNACGQIRGCGVKALLVQADVSQQEDVVKMVNFVVEEFGGLDILINNAGIQIARAAHELKIKDGSVIDLLVI